MEGGKVSQSQQGTWVVADKLDNLVGNITAIKSVGGGGAACFAVFACSRLDQAFQRVAEVGVTEQCPGGRHLAVG